MPFLFGIVVMITTVVVMMGMPVAAAFAIIMKCHRRALRAQDAVEKEALGKVREARVAGPQERGAGDLQTNR